MEYDREFFENSRKVGENGKGDAQPLCHFAFIWFRVQGLGFKVQGSGGGFAVFFIGRCQEVAFKSPVTSRFYDTGEGIVSHAWCQILRLSPHLFWLGLFTHSAFLSAQDDDGSVPTCSGWGFSHIERFRPLRMTIREGG